MKRRNANILIAAILIFIIYQVFYEPHKANERARKNYSVLHNAKINGHLSYIDHSRAFLYSFAVEGDTNYYCGLFVYLGKDSPKELQYFAKAGDSIVKNQYSDTLALIENGKEYYYEIRGGKHN